MSIASVIDLGIGPGGTIPFVITGGFNIASAAGALGKKKKADPRQWYTLPNGMRILATPENYRRFAAKYGKSDEVPAEPAALAASEQPDIPEEPPAPPVVPRQTPLEFWFAR